MRSKWMGAHLRAQDGVARLAHLLGEGHLGKRRACGNALRLEGVFVRGEHRRIRARRDGRGLTLLVRLARGSRLGGALGLLVLERGHERADADARGAQVGHLVDLEHGVDLAARLEDLLDLISGKRVPSRSRTS